MTIKKKEAAKSDPGPSAEILGLVGHYLTSFGLESTHKAFQKELQSLQKRSGWPAPADAATVSDLVPPFELGLLRMVQDAMKSNASSSDDTDEDSDLSDSDDSTSSSDDSDDSGNDSDGEKDLSGGDSDEDSESSGDSDGSNSDESSASDKLPQKVSQKMKTLKRSSSTSSSSSSSSSTSESSIDSDGDATVKPAVTQNLKRKVEVLSSSEPSSDSDSDSSSDDDHPVKRAKVVPATKSTKKPSKELSSDSDGDSSGDEADDRINGAKLTPEQDENSDSSNTVMGDNMAAASKPDSTKPPKKHVGARPTPLAELSAQATVDSHISNAYQSYDYADRAYKDLSVTRGKGFTKEKNKKKRGSYRGGAIDISGGKAFKFDD